MDYQLRKELYKELEELRDSNVITYITGDRKGWETKIHQEVLNFFTKHLDIMGEKDKLSLILYTRGGDTLAAWSIVNLLRQFCKELEVIIPSKAHSAGTLICLGANRIIMTKQATLGPIDPNVNTPLNPHIPGAPDNVTLPVSVEAINGYIELVKREFGIRGSKDLSTVIDSLTNKIHPLVLGEVYRARSQIKMLAEKLLKQHVANGRKKRKIIKFLCSESGSHDYTINRKEAMNDLGMTIEKPSDSFYKLIRRIFDTIQDDLELNNDFDPNIILGNNQRIEYVNNRALIESYSGGSHCFITEGSLTRTNQGGNILLNNQKTFEGWRYYNE